MDISACMSIMIKQLGLRLFVLGDVFDEIETQNSGKSDKGQTTSPYRESNEHWGFRKTRQTSFEFLKNLITIDDAFEGKWSDMFVFLCDTLDWVSID